MNRKMFGPLVIVAIVVPSVAMVGGSARLRAADYYVAITGSDTADGSPSQPLRTIQQGIDSATRPGDTVTVLPGTYREGLVIRSRGEPGNPIVIKAAQQQAVILDGAERVQGWQLLDGSQNVWAKEFGPPAPYNNDRGRWDMAPRSEQVFVDGKRCTHLSDDTDLGAMSDYTFTATRTDPARYVLKLPQGVNPDTATTEITVKNELLNVWGDNVSIDGFVFRRVRNTYQNATVTIGGEAIDFRNNLLEYSSAGSGLAIRTKRSHIHGNTFRSNGQFGFSLGGSDNLIENNLVQGNDLAGYKEWGTGGTKIVGNGNTIRRNRFINNLGGVAIWLDSGPCNNVVEYNYVSGNFGEGIRAEISFHSYIGYNIVENTKPCTSTMFGKTLTHCIGISVQNSAETCVVNNLVKDNLGVGIQLFTYNRPGDHLPQWQERYDDEKHRQWLRRSWDSDVVHAYDNVIYNNVVLQTIPDAQDACVCLRGLLNGQRPHCYGNQIDYTFYWNSVTHAPQVRLANVSEVPNGKSQWQRRYGMDAHAIGGFSPEDYRQQPFGTEYPYEPSVSFAGIGQGKDLSSMPWRVEVDYLGNPLNADRKPTMGHIEWIAK